MAEPECVGRAQEIGVITFIRTNAAGPQPSIAKLQSDGIFRLARQNPDWGVQLPFPKGKLDVIAILKMFPRGETGTDVGRIVPSQLGERFGQFL